MCMKIEMRRLRITTDIAFMYVKYNGCLQSKQTGKASISKPTNSRDKLFSQYLSKILWRLKIYLNSLDKCKKYSIYI